MMYKVTLLLKYRKDIPVEELLKDWRGSHGQLALTLPGIRRYVQNHWASAPPHYERLYDGSVDLWFDDEAAFNHAFSGPVGQAMIKDDLRLFDRSMTPAYIGGVIDEHVMLWEPGSDGRKR
jgi:uncharacterized protein (TIGR02118 family)